MMLWFVPTACRSHKRHHVVLSPPLPLAHTRGTRPPIACTRSLWFPVAGATGILPPIACSRGAPPSKVHVCTQKKIPMVVHPSSFCPPQQWHLASPMGSDLLLSFLSYGVLLPSQAHCSLTPQAVSTQPILVLSPELNAGA